MGESDTLLNASVGAVVSLATSFVPFSPVIGGAVAAYLERGDRRAGVRVGALSGLLYMLPMALFGLLVMLFVTGLFVTDGAGVALLFLVPLIGLFVLYSVGLSALGGIIGVYVREETEIGDGRRGTTPGRPPEWASRRSDDGRADRDIDPSRRSDTDVRGGERRPEDDRTTRRERERDERY